MNALRSVSVALLAALLCPPALAGDCLDGSLAVEDQVVVRLVPGASIEALLADYAKALPGVAPIASIPAIDAWLLVVPEPLCELDVVDALEDDERVLETTLNGLEQSSEGQTQSFYFVSIEGLYLEQYAWNLVELGPALLLADGGGATIAIVDSGIDAAHPAFVGIDVLPGIVALQGATTVDDVGNGIDDDGDGFVDESVGHGTHLAGLIARVAPGAALLPVRVLDSDGRTDEFTLASGVVAATLAGADVINVSIAAEDTIGIVDDAVAFAIASGRVVVASAGNQDATNERYPAALPGVIAVAATDENDAKARFSAFGAWIAIAAPGAGIVGPIPGGIYGAWSGTSMSAAIASGVAGLARGALGSPEAARAALLAGADDIADANPEYPGLLGVGRVNALGALPPRPADLDGDGAVGSADLALLLGAWGACTGCAADLDGDGIVGSADLATLLGAWS